MAPRRDPRTEPELTVVVVAGSRRQRLGGCLRSVLAQNLADRLEIVVVDCGDPSPGDDGWWMAHPSIRHLQPVPGSHYGEALAAGVEVARAPVVAFLEEHARAREGWARALLEAHQAPVAAVACEVHSGNGGQGFSDGWGLMGYGMWYAPLPAGETRFLHGYNSAIKRDVLRSYGDRLGRLLLADTVFALRLDRDGHRMANAPQARIDHLNEVALWAPLAKTFLAHRFSAPARAEECGWSRLRRLAYIAGSPLLPFYGLWCQARGLWARRPRLLWTLARILPQFFLSGWATGAGMAVGLLFGPGGSARDFTRRELDTERPEPGRA